MSHILIAFVGFIYLYIAIEQYFKGNAGTAITYFGYALGNVGLYMLANK